MKTKKRILVAPLDWGLGHATRCIPVISELIKQGAEVFVAASDKPLRLLQQEFPDLNFIRIPGYDIRYSKGKNMIWQMVASSPKIWSKIKQENSLLKKLIKRYKLDGIISDNRYGLWSEDIPSVIITHQLFIQSAIAQRLLHKITQNHLSKFDKVWVPDFEGENNLSGKLSHGKEIPKNVIYIGPLSRFYGRKLTKEEYKYDLMGIFSGPEPQRSILEAGIIEQIKKTNIKVLIVRGLADQKQEFLLSENIEVLPHLKAEAMCLEMNQSACILSRSGYSTIMDLAALGKKAILIPTPGQTEQEYLAEYHSSKGHFYMAKQSTFDLKVALKQFDKFEGLKLSLKENKLKTTIQQFLNQG